MATASFGRDRMSGVVISSIPQDSLAIVPVYEREMVADGEE